MALLTKPHADRFGDAPAAVDEFGTTSWVDFDRRVNQLTNALRSAGLAGDTIAVVAGNRREWFELMFACAHSGTVYVPVNWHWSADEVAYVLENSDAKVIFAGHRFADLVAEALTDERAAAVAQVVVMGDATLADERGIGYEEFLGSGATDEPETPVLGGPMFYTSGTTGRPKGVRGALTGSDEIPSEVLQLIAGGFKDIATEAGRTLLCGPTYHSAQWAWSFFPMVNGSATIIQHKFDQAALLDLIDEHGVTNIHLVPTQMKRLVDLPDEKKAAFDGSSLAMVWHGAAPCPPRVKREMIEWWGPHIHEYYGSTEGSVISMIDSNDWLRKGGSVGKPVETIEVIVLDDDGNVVTEGEGTLWFRNLMGMEFTYHKAPDKTAEAHRPDGAFTTGDIGYLDDEGFLWLSDRKIDMVISGGVNIYPAEIEGVIGGHAKVADVAVIGVPNEEFGEELKAVVVPNDGVPGDEALASELAAHCRSLLAGYKTPKSFDWAEALPRTGTGKIQKAKLRAPYWEGLDRRI